jgi:hypothetical protein
MKNMKSIAAAMFVATTLAFAGIASAAGGNRGGGHAASAHVASRSAVRAGMANQSGTRFRNRRFFTTNQGFPFYGYGGYGYGNQIVQNPDEADWSEQWTSLYEDNDGPYARSTTENPQGPARMWEFNDKQ